MRACLMAMIVSVSACSMGPYLEGEVTVVGGSAGACTTRDGSAIPVVRVSTRTAGDSVDTRDVACGGHFSLEASHGVYFLQAWVYTADGSTELGNGGAGPFDLTEVDHDVDVGTLTVALF